MKTFTALAAVAAGLAGLASGSAVAKRDASTPIIVEGNAFFQGNNRFYIRGVDYQPGGSSGSPGSTGANDPLEDDASEACLRDIKNFQDLGLNTIRVYTVDNSKGHDTCMNALKAAGIYLILDVNTPNAAINRDAPQESYNPTYLQNIFATMDAFAKYENTLAFLSGNEVINDTQASTGTAPYIKAVTRDMKNYIKSQNYRSIPIGYSGADVQSTRYETAEFLNCGPDNVRSDFFAFNDYSWCDPSSFQQSGWDKKVQLFSNYSIPIFLSEFGCITNGRDFEEVATLYSTQMTGVYSGGLVYEYSNEASGYGLGDISGSTYTPLKDFSALKTANQKTPLPSGDGGYRKDAGGASSCPPASSTWTWGNDTLPDLPSGAKQYFNGKGAGTGKGLGLFSMQAGGYSTSFSLPSGESSDHPSGTSTTGSGSSSSSSAATPMLIPNFSFVPLVIAGTWAVSAIFGGSALFL